jgi:hypothetical protein
MASGVARKGGKPKSMMACLDPTRSASLAIPAKAKTKESSNLAMSRAVFIESF